MVRSSTKNSLSESDSQHVIEAAAFDLSPIVITGGHDAVPLFEAVTAGGDGSIGGGNRACSAAVTGFLYFRAKKTVLRAAPAY